MVLKFACLSIHVQNDSLSFKFSVGTDDFPGKLEFFSSCIFGEFALLSHVSSKADHIDVFLDVVHDFCFKEGLCGIVHDLVAQFRFCDIFSELFDSSTLWWWAIFVNNFVALGL